MDRRQIACKSPTEEEKKEELDQKTPTQRIGGLVRTSMTFPLAIVIHTQLYWRTLETYDYSLCQLIVLVLSPACSKPSVY